MDKFSAILKAIRDILIVAVIAFASVHLVTGCVNQATAKSVVSAALKDAYALGGATAVSNRIERLVVEGKITEEQAAQLHIIAQGVYERVLDELDKSSASVVAEPCEDDANCGKCDQCRDND